jgi:hypothetical protein
VCDCVCVWHQPTDHSIEKKLNKHTTTTTSHSKNSEATTQSLLPTMSTTSFPQWTPTPRNMNEKRRRRGATWSSFGSFLRRDHGGPGPDDEGEPVEMTAAAEAAEAARSRRRNQAEQGGGNDDMSAGGAAGTDYSLLPDSSPNSEGRAGRRAAPSQQREWGGGQREDIGRTPSSASTMPADPSISTSSIGEKEAGSLTGRPDLVSGNGRQSSLAEGGEDKDGQHHPNPQHQPQQPQEDPPSRRQELFAECGDLFLDLLQYGRAKTWKKKLMTLTLCLSSLYVFYDLLFGGNIVVWLRAFILWMADHSIVAVFAFIGIFVVSTRE